MFKKNGTIVLGLCIAFLGVGCEKEELVDAKSSTQRNVVSTNQVATLNDPPDLTFVPNTGDWDASIDSVCLDNQYYRYFTRYEGWNGGDGVFSTALPDSRVLWSFGDSFFGIVDSTRNRHGADNVFVRNAALVQVGETFEGFTDLNPVLPNGLKTDLITHPVAGHWYWTQDATVYNNKLYMLLANMETTGSEGTWSFKHSTTDLAIYSLPDLTLERIVKDRYKGKTTFGGALLEDSDGFTYIYGTSHNSLNTTAKLHIARVPNGKLDSTWQHWDGYIWKTEPSSHAILDEASDEISVWKEGNKYYLLTQKPNLGKKIFVYEGNSPKGPWSNNPKTVYKVPDTVDTETTFTYNALHHPELSRDGELVISYSVNTENFFSNFGYPGSADIYRPRFVRVFGWK